MTTAIKTVNWLTGLALLTTSSMLAAQHEEAETDTAKNAELRQQIRQARSEMADAARRMARLQRQLGAQAGNIEVVHFRPDESPGDVEDVAIRLKDNAWFEDRKVNLTMDAMPPRLGVLLGGQDSDSDNQIIGLTPGAGAEAAGLKRGDRMVSVNGQPVAEGAPESIREALSDVEPGALVDVVIERDGEPLSFEIETSSMLRDVSVMVERLAPRAVQHEREIVIMQSDGSPHNAEGLPKLPHMAPRFPGLGVHSDLISNHPGLQDYFGTPDGVIVLRIDSDNTFSLEDGDVVLTLDGEPVNRPVELGRQVLIREPGEKIVLEVMRNSVLTQLAATIPERTDSLQVIPMRKIKSIKFGPGAGQVENPAAPQPL